MASLKEIQDESVKPDYHDWETMVDVAWPEPIPTIYIDRVIKLAWQRATEEQREAIFKDFLDGKNPNKNSPLVELKD